MSWKPSGTPSAGAVAFNVTLLSLALGVPGS
jgi:hypothetical protein